jgi:hypothetical protein
MKHTLLIVFTLIFLCFSKPSFAGICDEHLRLIIDNLNKVEEVIPKVTKEQAEEFKKQREEILATGKPEDLKALRDNDLYLAWEVRSQFRLAKSEALRLRYIPSEITVKKRLQESAFLPYRLSNARDSWTKYLENLTDTISSNKATAASITMLSLGHTTGVYLLCLAEHLEPFEDNE